MAYGTNLSDDDLARIDEALKSLDVHKRAFSSDSAPFSPEMVFTPEEAEGAASASPFQRAPTPEFLRTGGMPPGRGQASPMEPSFAPMRYQRDYSNARNADDRLAEMEVEELMRQFGQTAAPQGAARQSERGLIGANQPDTASLDLRRLPSFGAGQDSEKAAFTSRSPGSLSPDESYAPYQPSAPAGFASESDFDSDINTGLADRKKFEGPEALIERERLAAAAEVEARRTTANSRYQNATGAQRQSVIDWINRPMAEFEERRSRQEAGGAATRAGATSKASGSVESELSREAQDAYIRRLRAAGEDVNEEDIRAMSAEDLPDPAGALGGILTRAEEAAEFERQQRARAEAEWLGVPSNRFEREAMRERARVEQRGAQPRTGSGQGGRRRANVAPESPARVSGLANFAAENPNIPEAEREAAYNRLTESQRATYENRQLTRPEAYRDLYRSQIENLTPEARASVEQLLGTLTGNRLDDEATLANIEQTIARGQKIEAQERGAAAASSADVEQMAAALGRIPEQSRSIVQANRELRSLPIEVIGNALLGRGVPPGATAAQMQRASQLISSVRSGRLSQMGGAAISPSEDARLTESIAAARTNDPEVFLQAVGDIVEIIQQAERRIRAGNPNAARQLDENMRQLESEGTLRVSRRQMQQRGLSEADVRRRAGDREVEFVP